MSIIALGATTFVFIYSFNIKVPKTRNEWVIAGCNETGNAITFYGGIQAIKSFFDLMESYDFADACRRGLFCVECVRIMGIPSFLWESWDSPNYINKYHLGMRGTITKNVTYQKIVDWCGWKLAESGITKK